MHDYACKECGFVSTGWPTKKAAAARGAEHTAEHESYDAALEEHHATDPDDRPDDPPRGQAGPELKDSEATALVTMQKGSDR